MSRLKDIADSSSILIGGTEIIEGITQYQIERSKGSFGATLVIVLPKICNVEAGTSVEFKGYKGIVSSTEMRGSGKDYFVTVLNCIPEMAVLLRKSPAKTLTYMSMTPEEKDDFVITCKGDFSGLEYVPLIKICNPQTQTGGWTSREVIEDLLQRRGGFEVVCNVYSFWVKQVSASNQSSYLDSALALVSFLRPITYEEDGVLYILERPLVGGSASIDNCLSVVQRDSYDYDATSKYFQVRGGYGKWIRDKSRVKVEPEKETQIVTTTYMEKPQLVTVLLRGEAIIDKVTGKTTGYGWGGQEDPVVAKYSYWLKEPAREKHTITETHRLDPYGNFKAILSRHRVAYSITSDAILSDSLEEYKYDFLTEEFERARLVEEIRTENKFSWKIVSGAFQWRRFSSRVAETSKVLVYTENGTLLEQIETKSSDVVRLFGADDYAVMDVADQFYNAEGQSLPVEVERMVVEETVTKFTPVGYDMYQKSTTTRKLGPLARKVGQENYSTKTEMVRGRLPRSPRLYRKMLVYADNLPPGDVSVDVPIYTVSNPNIIDWNDAAEILGRVMEFAKAESSVKERTIVVAGDIPIDLGWPLSLDEVIVGKKHEAGLGDYEEEVQVIPSVEGNLYSRVVAFSKEKSSSGPTSTTTIIVEAK